MDTRNDEQRAEQARELLDQAPTSDHARSRLATARQAAVDAADARSQRQQKVWGASWLPAGALAATVALVAVGVLNFQDEGAPLPVELVAAEEGVEFYEELDFVLWLDDQQLAAVESEG